MADRITAEQVGRISAEFKQRGVAVEIETTGGIAFMHAVGQLLVQEDGTKQVVDFLRQSVNVEKVEAVIPGVNLVHFGTKDLFAPAPTVREIVDLISKQVQFQIAESDDVALAAPNYVLTVAPGGPCPATEPEEAYFDIEPSPGVRMVADGSDGHEVRVYVADTGLLADAATHEWLKGVHGEPDPLEPVAGEMIKPYAGHGTFVAGVLRCMAPKAEVFVSNAFKVAGSTLESDFVQDLYRALDHQVDIFNLSVTTRAKNVSGLLGFGVWLKLLREHHRGTVCVVAAGNDNSEHKFWPAAFKGMVSVGALSADGRDLASFSNHDGWVKVYAPGRDLINAYATGTYQCQDAPYTGQLREFYGMAKWSGTSFSTPLVAGLIAARKSCTGQTAREAADSLLALAQTQAIPGVGPVLLPYDNAFGICDNT